MSTQPRPNPGQQPQYRPAQQQPPGGQQQPAGIGISPLITTGGVIPPSIVPIDVPPPTGIAAIGTKLQVLSAANPEDFTVIANMGDITGPSTSLAEVETTSHSTAKPHRTFIPALIDDGTISFPCHFNPSDPTHSLYSPFGLENLFQNRTTTKWRLINTDMARRTRSFFGFVQSLNETYPVAGIASRAVVVRINSVPTDEFSTVTLVPVETLTVPTAGGSFTITVTSTDTMLMGWFPVSNNPSWITITAPTLYTVGDGEVSYTVQPYTGGSTPRTGSIRIGDQTFSVTQANV